MLYFAILFLILFNIKNIKTEEVFLYDEEKVYDFLEFKVSINEVEICDTDIATCDENDYIISFNYNVCWNEGDISPEFPYLSELKTLKIIGNENNFCLKNNVISEKIFELPKLEELYLENFKVSDIPQNINSNSSISYIEIENSKFEEFPTQLIKLSNLKYFILKNSIIDHLPKEFAEFPSLEELQLYNNTYTNKELVIPNKVKRLDVSNEGFTSVLKDNYNKDLVTFDCVNSDPNKTNKNNFTINDNFNENIFDSLANYKNLKIINLKNNKLIKRIPSSIKELTSLEILDLDYTNIEEVSKEYFELPNLKKSLILKNKNTNENNLTLFKRCEKNNEINTPCFDINEEEDDHNMLKKTGIFISTVVTFSLIIATVGFIYFKIKKRNKFEKIRKKIIDDVTNEVENSSSQNSNHNLHDDNNNNNNNNLNRSNTNSQSNIIIINDNDSQVSNDITNVNQPLNRGHIININDAAVTNSNDINENTVTLPTYMESISQSNSSYYLRMAQNLDSKLRPPQSENKKRELSDNIVDAEVVIPTPTDYYEERLRRKILIENRRNAMSNSNSHGELPIDDDKHSFSINTNENVVSRTENNNDTEISDYYSVNNNNETEHIILSEPVEQNNDDNINGEDHEIIINENIDGEPSINDILQNNSNIKEYSEISNSIDIKEQNNNTSAIDIPETDNSSMIEENSCSSKLDNNEQKKDLTEISHSTREEINNNSNTLKYKDKNNSTIKTINNNNNVNKNKLNNNLIVDNENGNIYVYSTNSLINNNVQYKESKNNIESKSVISQNDVETKSITSVTSSLNNSDIKNEIEEIFMNALNKNESEEIIIKNNNNNNNK